MLYSFMLLYTLFNPCPYYSLVNSVDFSPDSGLFCATYTHGNRVVLYEEGQIVQELTNPIAQLSEPQHAAFSPDGKILAVANWTNQTINLYQKGEGSFVETPVSITPIPKQLERARPHGLAFSPCGRYLALAYGASTYYDKALALIHMAKNQLEWQSIVKELPGIPKGITFTADGSHLLVTFADLNCLHIYEVKDDKIAQKPKQVIEDPSISRPEDVKLTADGLYVALSNSDAHTVTFYSFANNRITDPHPCYILEGLSCFPHGLAFSPDGQFMAVTEFGSIQVAPSGDITWDAHMAPRAAQIKVFRKKYHVE